MHKKHTQEPVTEPATEPACAEHTLEGFLQFASAFFGRPLGQMGSVAGEAGKEQRSATPRSLTGWVGGDNKTERAATKPDFDSRVVCGNEKAGAGWVVRHRFFVDAHYPHTAAVA